MAAWAVATPPASGLSAEPRDDGVVVALEQDDGGVLALVGHLAGVAEGDVATGGHEHGPGDGLDPGAGPAVAGADLVADADLDLGQHRVQRRGGPATRTGRGQRGRPAPPRRRAGARPGRTSGRSAWPPPARGRLMSSARATAQRPREPSPTVATRHARGSRRPRARGRSGPASSSTRRRVEQRVGPVRADGVERRRLQEQVRLLARALVQVGAEVEGHGVGQAVEQGADEVVAQLAHGRGGGRRGPARRRRSAGLDSGRPGSRRPVASGSARPCRPRPARRAGPRPRCAAGPGGAARGRRVEVGEGRDDGGQPAAQPALGLELLEVVEVVRLVVGGVASRPGRVSATAPTVRSGADRVGDPMATEPDDELVVVVPAAHQAGVWANDAIVHSSDHEVTVDLLRVDHSVEPEDRHGRGPGGHVAQAAAPAHRRADRRLGRLRRRRHPPAHRGAGRPSRRPSSD